jgi:hypothetical protein
MRLVALAASLFLVVILCGCSSGPAAPEKGTPPFYWAAAKESFAAGDFLKTNDNLDGVLKTENEFKALAQPWALVLSSGLAHGYINMADAFEQGSRANKTNPASFRKTMNDERRFARSSVLQFQERFQNFQKAGKDDPVRLAFPFPNGTTAQPQIITKVSSGIMASPAEIENGHKAVLQRNIILETSRAAGAGDDATKARPAFSSGEARIPRADFMTWVASSLHDQAQIYAPLKLDEPDKMKMICQQALDVLKGLPESKQTKDLAAKIEKTMKAPRPRT